MGGPRHQDKTILIALIFTLLVIYCFYINQFYDFFIKLKIPGPEPQFFMGNFWEIIKARSTSFPLKAWTEKYGSLYGYFEGHTPMLVCSDPDILQDVFIKQFSNFHSRRLFPTEELGSRSINLSNAIGLRWKRQRLVINPTFSSIKLKQMSPLMNSCIDQLMHNLEVEYQKKTAFDIYTLYKRLTMDVIWTCGFGVDTDMQNNPDNPYLTHSLRVFSDDQNNQLLILLALLIKELDFIWIGLLAIENNMRYWIQKYLPFMGAYFDEEPSAWILKRVEQIIKQRKESDVQRNDLMQLMLESATDKEIKDSGSSLTHIGAEGVAMVKKITLKEISANIYLFMIAGYETTATALAYCTYALVTHPHEQYKLQESIDQHFDPENDCVLPDYDTVANMEYLDWFIRETLRFYPIAPVAVNRVSSEPFEIKDVGTIPAGTNICIDMYSLHFNQKLWGPVNVNTFYPERFRTKRHPMAWMPFGAGPRNCVGMKFALTEMKIALARLLKTYSVVKCDTTEKYFELKEYICIHPQKMMINLQRRDGPQHAE
ncbi:unnamed protein product [Didymodactylos carnosus]|uniref:Cytochrome P450 n=1 Tax=Didymodactylos carnosus TaxID=1234261 RepID=A0A814ZNU5_9BILA|nr:unnamed protein product [Didymodactylos carnosus]CAF1244350.1 unnamed protein product [Didymodactylos carnosus]CAF3753590.1 unnamed protein product [Didymodactylos carnosus]CAF4009234.1 unnamed protein product [Didymodactylos carnosus]